MTCRTRGLWLDDRCRCGWFNGSDGLRGWSSSHLRPDLVLKLLGTRLRKGMDYNLVPARSYSNLRHWMPDGSHFTAGWTRRWTDLLRRYHKNKTNYFMDQVSSAAKLATIITKWSDDKNYDIKWQTKYYEGSDNKNYYILLTSKSPYKYKFYLLFF